MKKIDYIVKNDLCCGCGSCSNIFEGIKMEYDKNGNLRPNYEYIDSINSKALKEYNNVCPGIKTYSDSKYEIDGKLDNIWGRYDMVITGYAKDSIIRHRGSSGGSITGILSYLIDKKIVDGVIHIGVSETNPILNVIKISRSVEEIVNNSGSRYSPSSPLEGLKEILNSCDGYFAFVGKPCDAVAIRNYMKNNEYIRMKIKYVISFFCAGVPSIKGTEKILEINNVKKEHVKEFRYRGDGWPGYTKITTKSNKEYKMTYGESWGTVLNRYLPKRCKICPDGIGESADIVCGDAWHGDKEGYPTFEESDGRSLIISRTNAGTQLIDEAIKNNYICKEEIVDFENLKNIQPFQFYRKTTLIYRLLAMRILLKYTPKYNKRVLLKASKENNLKEHFKSFLGTFIRVLKNKM